jgi:hypothetical protein
MMLINYCKSSFALFLWIMFTACLSSLSLAQTSPPQLPKFYDAMTLGPAGVNMADGNIYTSEVDVSVGSGNFPSRLELARFYSIGQRGSSTLLIPTIGGYLDHRFGANWSHNWDIELQCNLGCVLINDSHIQ